MTTFKPFWLLALILFSASSHSSDPIAWDELLVENQRALLAAGHFVKSDDHFYYLGFKSEQQDSLDAEFEFLLAFQDQASGLLADLCEKSQSSLLDSYQFNVPFTKNMVEQRQSLVFIATVRKTALGREARTACH
jgi:hypothetical protein